MKNTSLTSVLGFLLSLPGIGFVFLYVTDSLGRGYEGLTMTMLALATSSLSALFAFISLYYVYKGSSGKLTYFALVVDVVVFIVLAAAQ